MHGQWSDDEGRQPTSSLFAPPPRRVPHPARAQILIAERCVLHTLGFKLTVEHPYSTVMSLLKKLFTLGRGANGGKGVNKARNRQLSQVLFVTYGRKEVVSAWVLKPLFFRAPACCWSANLLLYSQPGGKRPSLPRHGTPVFFFMQPSAGWISRKRLRG